MPVLIARTGVLVIALTCAAGCTGSLESPTARPASSVSAPAVPSTAATTPNAAPPPTPVAQPVRFATRPDNLCAPLLRHYYPPPTTGSLPRSSTVTAARWCVTVFTAHGPRVQLRQAAGDLTALDRALHAPSAPRPKTPAVCAAIGYAVYTLEVLDQHGRLFNPTPPTSECGALPGTRDALAAIEYTVLSSRTPSAQ